MSNWISVEDELPPSEWVLLCWRPKDHKERDFNTDIIIGMLGHDSKSVVWGPGRHYDIETHITHWMPLPDKPPNQ